MASFKLYVKRNDKNAFNITKYKSLNILINLVVGLVFAFIFWLPLFVFSLLEILDDKQIYPTLYSYLHPHLYLEVFILIGVIAFIVFIAYSFYKKKLDYRILVLIVFFLLIPFYLYTYFGYFPFFEWALGLFYLLSLGVFLLSPRVYRISFGFFTGVLGLYWIALSLRFFNLGYAMPIVIIALGIYVAVLFYFLLWFKNPIIRIVALLILGLIHPLSFNWFDVKFFSAYTIFEPTIIAMIVLSVAVILLKNKDWLSSVIAMVFILYSMQFSNPDFKFPNLDIKLAKLNYNQTYKDNPNNFPTIAKENLEKIDQAINEKKDLIILPESAFPFILNESPLEGTLKNLSTKIAIVTGALRSQGKDVYNTTFIFNRGEVKYIDKVELVPFGERLPFTFILGPLYRHLNMGSFSAGSEFKSFKVQGLSFDNAICYEATTPKSYEKVGKYMVTTSNNAWFMPSLEPYFQKIIMKYYARRYKIVNFHATNFSPTFTITPNMGLDMSKK
ncbi:apolipoprotein N-acyltransferase [Helicobacter sp. 11S02629-2]|uniref:apolipoprotein N-acyltransferase n=1 Tax=Helicobacter sp. 11S02629-2 TaxID=1476195 RepID=UPI000BA60FF9|nr:apolipoprotein N-acyltransferase [Helicobacter sp. 11S02629-2]PAF45887.1 apolipoprotein N-acyltransferase [Helicobacter sp. 11S02629-2]